VRTALRRNLVGVVGRVASSRAGGDASILAGGLRLAFHAVDPGLPPPRLVSAASFVARATQQQRASGRP